MANVVVPVTDLVLNERSGDAIAGGTAIAAADTFEVDVENRTDQLIFVIEENAASAAEATITFDAGPEPPSLLGAHGDLDVVLAADDLRVFALEGGRFIQTTGKITGSMAGAARLSAYRIPKRW